MNILENPVPEVDVATAARWLDAGEAVMVDIREEEEWEDERIPGAILLPMSTFDPSALPARTPGQRLIVQCRSGRRSHVVAHQLRQLGHTEVYNLVGGIIDWYEAGLPTVTGDAAAA